MENQNFNPIGTNPNGFAPQAPVGAQPVTGAVEKNCPQCGAFIPQTQAVCHVCGYNFNAPEVPQQMPPQQPLQQPVPDAGAVNEAINNFNTQLEKKNKKKKVVPVILAVVAVVVIAFGALYFSLTSKADAVISAIQREEIDSEEVQLAYDGLTPVGEMLFGTKIQDAFVARVKANPYVASENKIPVNPSSMLMYYEFNDIADIIGVDETTHPSVMAYIDAVLELSAYVDYGTLYLCVYSSIGGYSDAISLLASSFNNIDEAYAYVKAGYEKALEYDTCDLTKGYVNEYGKVYDELRDWYIYGYRYYYTDVDVIIDAYDVFKVYIAKIDTARAEVDALVAQFPVIE